MLVGIDRLEPTWRRVLPDVLATAAGGWGVVVDLRSPSNQAEALAAMLSERWPVRLDAPAPDRRSWTLTLSVVA